jgi:Icc protein
MQQTIAYITDIHLDEAFVLENGVDPRTNWKHILNDVHNRGIDQIIFGGDIGEPTTNEWFFNSLTAFQLNITLGNHDTFTEASHHYNKQEWAGTAEGYYSKEDNAFKYLFLDSSQHAISQEQITWLTKELNTNKRLLLFIHHPILPVDTAVDRAYPLQNRKEILEILQQRNSDTYIFCGHYHMADERTSGTIRQFITPAASYQIVKGAQELKINTDSFGYRLIHLNDQHITTEVIWLDQPTSPIN